MPFFLEPLLLWIPYSWYIAVGKVWPHIVLKVGPLLPNLIVRVQVTSYLKLDIILCLDHHMYTHLPCWNHNNNKLRPSLLETTSVNSNFPPITCYCCLTEAEWCINLYKNSLCWGDPTLKHLPKEVMLIPPHPGIADSQWLIWSTKASCFGLRQEELCFIIY